MDRRTFVRVVTGSLVILPTGFFLVRCGGSAAENGPHIGTTNTYTSTETAGHSHTFTIDTSEFTSPPADGIQRDTSTVSGHGHVVTVSMAQLQNVQAGQSVTVTTSSVSGHTHDFTFTKMA